MPRRAPIPQRRRVFVGCEGESEQSYVRVLQRLLDAAGAHIHLDAQVLQPGGGDAAALLRIAQHRIARLNRRDVPFESCWLILDADVVLQRHGEAEFVRLTAQAEVLGIGLVWQDCCHEALLLRHLPGCGQLRPPTAALALQELSRRMPGYEKGWPAIRLQPSIDMDAIRRAAAVEPYLRAFLNVVMPDGWRP